jgi:hypothetical protein
VSRLRPRIWRRVLLAVAAIALYAVIAFTLAALIPEGSWPAIGDSEYSSAQATVVPAINVLAVGTIILALLQPVIPIPALIVHDILLGAAAAAVGPVLAVVSGESPSADLITSGILALAAVGIVIALARSRVTWDASSTPSGRLAGTI